MSLTVTAKDVLVVLPEASLTEQFTVVVPFANEDPGGGEQMGTPTPGQLSETVGSV